MTFVQTLTTLMDAARNYYQTDRKLSFTDLTSMLKPAPNLLTNTDNFSGNGYLSDSNATISDQSYQGIKCYKLPANVHDQPYVGAVANLEAGNYVFSFFLYCSIDNAGNNAFDIDSQIHKAFAVEKGWHRYVIPFNTKDSATNIYVTNWVPADCLVAGYKLEKGERATPYLRADGTLVKAPEILLGG